MLSSLSLCCLLVSFQSPPILGRDIFSALTYSLFNQLIFPLRSLSGFKPIGFFFSQSPSYYKLFFTFRPLPELPSSSSVFQPTEVTTGCHWAGLCHQSHPWGRFPPGAGEAPCSALPGVTPSDGTRHIPAWGCAGSPRGSGVRCPGFWRSPWLSSVTFIALPQAEPAVLWGFPWLCLWPPPQAGDALICSHGREMPVLELGSGNIINQECLRKLLGWSEKLCPDSSVGWLLSAWKIMMESSD